MWKQRGRYEEDMLYCKVPSPRLYLTLQTMAFVVNLSLYVNVNRIQNVKKQLRYIIVTYFYIQAADFTNCFLTYWSVSDYSNTP